MIQIFVDPSYDNVNYFRYLVSTWRFDTRRRNAMLALNQYQYPHPLESLNRKIGLICSVYKHRGEWFVRAAFSYVHKQKDDPSNAMWWQKENMQIIACGGVGLGGGKDCVNTLKEIATEKQIPLTVSALEQSYEFFLKMGFVGIGGGKKDERQAIRYMFWNPIEQKKDP